MQNFTLENPLFQIFSKIFYNNNQNVTIIYSKKKNSVRNNGRKKGGKKKKIYQKTANTKSKFKNCPNPDGK